MLSVKMFHPYYVKISSDYIHVLLAEKCFSILIDEKQFEFIPEKDKEIKINRNSNRIVNKEAIFVFHHDEEQFDISMKELMDLPDFLIKLFFITKPYMGQKYEEEKVALHQNTDYIIEELEYLNVKRLIDKALDERDEAAFYNLLEKL